METPKYYKVVYEASSGRLLSSWTADNIFAVEYKLNEFVYPKVEGSKLFVFNHFSYALGYRECSPLCLTIYECEIINPSFGEVMSASSSSKDWMDFWRRINIYCTRNCLPGTVFCDAVKLVKKIDS